MTDEQLAAYLGLTPDEAAIIIPKLTPEHRATFDKMHDVQVETELWVAGLGPKPKGVLIDLPRGGRRAALTKQTKIV